MSNQRDYRDVLLAIDYDDMTVANLSAHFTDACVVPQPKGILMRSVHGNTQAIQQRLETTLGGQPMRNKGSEFDPVFEFVR